MEFQIHQCIASRLRRLSRITDGYLRKVLKDFDVTENQMNILFALNELGKIEQGIIGKKLVLERSTISRAVSLLEKREYIFKTSNYQPEIELTTKGTELVKKMMPFWEDFMNKMCEKIGENGFRKLSYLESKIV